MILCCLLALAYVWHIDLNSQKTVEWIAKGGGTYGQIFDLGMVIGALLGVGAWLCLPKKN